MTIFQFRFGANKNDAIIEMKISDLPRQNDKMFNNSYELFSRKRFSWNNRNPEENCVIINFKLNYSF